MKHNPVEALGHGRYRYGKSGKIYKGRGAKSKAAKQGRAIEFRRHSGSTENPSSTTILVIGGGIALLGVAAYFLLRKPAATTPAVTASSAPQLPPGPIVYTDSNGVPYTKAQACATATKLTQIGHPSEAAFWQKLCTG